MRTDSGLQDENIWLQEMNGAQTTKPAGDTSQEDIEKVAGTRLSEAGSALFSVFKQAGITPEDAFRYAITFRDQKVDVTILPYLDKDEFKNLQVKLGDIVRIQRAMEAIISGTNTALSQPDPVEMAAHKRKNGAKVVASEAEVKLPKRGKASGSNTPSIVLGMESNDRRWKKLVPAWLSKPRSAIHGAIGSRR